MTRQQIWQKRYDDTRIQTRKAVDRNAQLRKNYGITLAEYNAMFAAQNGLCKGCYGHQSSLRKSLSVDHNHATGKVRGLLCDRCNVALGMVRDDIQVLNRLAAYLGGK